MKLQLSNIQKSFGAKTVLAGANFQVRDKTYDAPRTFRIR